MTILSISIAGMLVALVIGRKNISVPDHRTAALNYAVETLEDLKGKVGISGITPGRGDLDAGTDVVDALPSSEIKDTFGGTRTYTITNIGGSTEDDYHYKKVTVTVDWDEPD